MFFSHLYGAFGPSAPEKIYKNKFSFRLFHNHQMLPFTRTLMESSQAQHDLQDVWMAHFICTLQLLIPLLIWNYSNIQAPCMLKKSILRTTFCCKSIYYSRLKRLSFCFVLVFFPFYFMATQKLCPYKLFCQPSAFWINFVSLAVHLCLYLVVCSAEFFTYHPLFKQTAKSELRCQMFGNAFNAKQLCRTHKELGTTTSVIVKQYTFNCPTHTNAPTYTYSICCIEYTKCVS